GGHEPLQVFDDSPPALGWQQGPKRQVAAILLQALKPLPLRLRALPHVLALEFGLQVFECGLVRLDVRRFEVRTIRRFTRRTFEWGIVRRGPLRCLEARDFFGPVSTVPAARADGLERAIFR